MKGARAGLDWGGEGAELAGARGRAGGPGGGRRGRVMAREYDQATISYLSKQLDTAHESIWALLR